MPNIQAYYDKLARNEAITEDEVVTLLKAVTHYKESLAYLASCQAATLESLPKSVSNSRRGRHVALCEAAAAMLLGNKPTAYPTNAEHARNRCLEAIKNSQRPD